MLVTCTVRAVCEVVPALMRWSDVISNFQVVYSEPFFPRVGWTQTRVVDIRQVAVCLITCNLLIIVTYFYRVLGYQDHDSTSDTTEQDSTVEKHGPITSSSKPQQMSLTTIEHLSSTESGNSALVAGDETVLTSECR